MENLKKMEQVMDYVSRYYVDDVDWDSVSQKTVEFFLSQLDPHSVYIPAKDVAANQESFEGKFQGIGIYFDVINDYLTVISPIPDSPSDRAGLVAGDRIIEIDGESAIGISNSEVQKRLKGPKGTAVNLLILRNGIDEAMEFELIRDDIPIFTVTTYFVTADSTGYISLNRFAKTTEQEVEDALTDMENIGMQRLILDLRSNGGGFLDQAVKIAAKFIHGHQKIVFTRGKLKQFNNDYYADNFKPDKVRDFPLIVLIDYGSASASEIVAGAIQDYDRGLIVGETSFGKGLVQNEFPLSDDSRLRLTISKYYTPSGRIIQRPYKGKNIDEYYQDAFAASASDSSISVADSADAFVYYTRSGRKVYGGGGIHPDTIVAYQTLVQSPQLMQKLYTSRLFFELSAQYAREYTQGWNSFSRYLKEFKTPESALRRLRSLAAERGIEISEKEFFENKAFFKHRIKAEFARNHWGLDKFYRVLLQNDNQFQSARTLFDMAQNIMNRPKNMTLNN
jgi:carboxyl-terminal processing protease